MASFQAGKRDPLLDSETQAALEKRSKELLGFALIGVGLLFAAMLWSYTPTDPSWISATDAPVQNWLGQTGASAAAAFMTVIGKGAWMIPFGFIGWGLRFALHAGHDRAMTRAIFVPFAVIVASVYAATLAPAADWPANFGVGGLLGDTVLGALLIVLPIGTTLAVKLMSLVLAMVMLALAAFSLGVIREEVRATGRFLFVGVVMAYAMVLRLLGRGAVASAQAAGGVGQAIAARREDARQRRAALDELDAVGAEAEYAMPDPRATSVVRPQTYDADEPMMPPVTATPEPAPELVAPERPAPQQTGFLKGLLKRAAAHQEDEQVPATLEDRISARIAAAVSTHKGPEPKTDLGARIEPALTRGRGPQPMILDTNAAAEESPMLEAAIDGAVLDDAVVEDMAADAVRPVLRRGAEVDAQAEAPPAIPMPEPKKVVRKRPHAGKRIG